MKYPKDIPVRSFPTSHSNGIVVAKVSSVNFLEDDETMQSHRHDYHFFVLMKSGISITEIDFKQYEINQPTILYQSPNQVHRAIKVENVDMYMLIISKEHIHHDCLNILQNIAPLEPLSINGEDLELVEESFCLAQKLGEKHADKLHFPIVKDSANALVTLLTSLFLQQIKTGDSLSRFERISTFFFQELEQHYHEWKRPADYALQLHISVAYLNECVKNVTGFSVSHVIQERVILEAKRLLFHSEKSVKEIATELGYDDYPYFSRLFTKVVGMSPKAFKAKNHD